MTRLAKSAALLGLVAIAVAAGSAISAPVAKDALFDAMRLRPGLWRSTLRIAGGEMRPLEPGGTVPPEQAEALRGRIGMTMDADECLSGRNPRGDLILPGIRIAHDCRFERIDAGRGQLILTAECGDRAGGFWARIDARARYTARSMESTIDNLLQSRGQGILTRLSVTISSRYQGQCIPVVRSPIAPPPPR
jgi:hypothetical protein